uniref:Nonstructural protein n=1 Tax=Ficedula parva ambidensovirus TaxID=2794460 RepID=A0A8E7L4F7_9VIRU|nr:MAG: nonstructural protein [Ficedula parva ambidensovirus]
MDDDAPGGKRRKLDEIPREFAGEGKLTDEQIAKPEDRAGGHNKMSEKRGGHIFPPDKPLKIQNKATHRFTKHFYFKIYANDWQRIQASDTTQDVIGFMSWIPWQALCMYLSPSEYMRLVRDSSYAKIKSADFQLEFKAVRTPFDTNSTDAAEANGNLQFEIQRWDGLEMMLPFETLDVGLGASPTLNRYKTYAELIERLYGGTAFSAAPSGTNTWPATMRERGLTYRPLWRFNRAGDQATAFGPLYRDVNAVISALPIGEYVTERLNTNQVKMGEGYCFCKSYKPKNGIIAAASSAFSAKHQAVSGVNTRINTKTRMRDEANNLAPTSVDSPQYGALWPVLNTTATVPATYISESMVPRVNQKLSFGGFNACPIGGQNRYCAATQCQDDATSLAYFGDNNPGTPNPTNFALWNTSDPSTFKQQQVISADATALTTDNFGYGYNNAMAWYQLADLENYAQFTSNQDPPIHHMPSMMLGAVPKTNKDNTIVNATLEFECTTSIEIETQYVDPTYFNCSFVGVPDGTYTTGYMDPASFPNGGSGDTKLFGGKWMHNEIDVVLRDPKYWVHNYGRAGKPLFADLPADVPTI